MPTSDHYTAIPIAETHAVARVSVQPVSSHFVSHNLRLGALVNGGMVLYDTEVILYHPVPSSHIVPVRLYHVTV